ADQTPHVIGLDDAVDSRSGPRHRTPWISPSKKGSWRQPIGLRILVRTVTPARGTNLRDRLVREARQNSPHPRAAPARGVAARLTRSSARDAQARPPSG